MPDITTLAEAKDWLRERLDDGERCPCCTQFAKTYKRAIHTSMASGLIKVAVRRDWVEIAGALVHREIADFGKLAYWDLAEPMPGERDDGSKRVGIWRATPRGQAFVTGAVTVPKHAVIYDGRRLRYDGPEVSIQDCLGKKFNYEELMAGA